MSAEVENAIDIALYRGSPGSEIVFMDAAHTSDPRDLLFEAKLDQTFEASRLSIVGTSSASLTDSLKNRFRCHRLLELFRCSARGGTCLTKATPQAET